MARRRSRPLSVFLALAALLMVVGAAMLAADWWIAIPADRAAQYVGRQECVRCHEQESRLWEGSDHDLAMDLATPQTVLGDFDNRRFTHVAFENLTKLSDQDLQTLAGEVELSCWARALETGNQPVKEKLLRALLPSDAAALTALIGDLAPVRPCETIEAYDQIVETARRLKDAGRITIDVAVTSTMFRRGEKFCVTTDGPTGKMETFEIKYVFGYRPLQQYLIGFPDGRVQCLGIAWDTQRRRWFHLYPGETIPANDELHWTRPLQNWNYMCAECHSTNLQKNYDLATNTYHTTWSEIDVSCETCHGPGSLHVELADSYGFFWDRRIGYGLPRLKEVDSRVEIETCAPCHARRGVVHPGWTAGRPLLDYYFPELLDNDLYYADGQILEEDYEYGSFIQSKMYAKGVRCSDCHDPHSTRVKHYDTTGPFGQPIDNRLCTDCHIGVHPAGKYDTPAHHHHPDSSKPGTRCVECHMPESTYMVVDPRRDHSMSSPRPDLTLALGIPNACNGCHHDRAKGETPQWAEATVRGWYGPIKGPRHFAYALAAGRAGKQEGEQQLEALTRRQDASPIVRASALTLLVRYPTQTGPTAAMRSLRDPEALVRAAAVRSLLGLPSEDLVRRLAPRLGDPIRSVRTETARVLCQVPRDVLRPQDRQALDAALAEYFQGQRSLDDQPAAHLNMGVVLTNLGDLAKAQQQYDTALRLDPRFIPARVNLAMLYDLQAQQAEAADDPSLAKRKKAAAEAEFRDVIRQQPAMAEAHYSLGLLLAENEDRLAEAAESLALAARLAPNNPRIHYNYGLALQRLGRPDQAEEPLQAACRLAPDGPDFLHALAILYTQQKRWAEAVRCAEALARLQPGNREFQGLLQYVRRESAGNSDR